MISKDGTKLIDTASYSFAEFTLEAENLLLLKSSEVVPLAPKAVEVLLALIEAGGKLITKQEILDKVWANTFVEEANLTHHISALRKALGEDKNGRKFIETISRKGYRFVADVKTAANCKTAEIIINERNLIQIVEETTFTNNNLTSDAATPTKIISPNADLSPPSSADKKRRYERAIAAALIVLLIGAAAFFGWRKFISAGNSNAKREVSIKRLTPDADAIASSVSPDGASVVFSRDEKGQEILWRKQIASGEMTQLLPASPIADGRIIYTRFSPDGKWIYYGYAAMQGLSVYRIPANGGSPQKVVADVWTDFAISPDGKQIAYCFDFRQIIVADIETGEKRVVAERDSLKQSFKGNDYDSVAWSPDGSKLAVAGSVFDGQRNVQQLLEIDVKTGAEKVIAIGKSKFQQIEWLADGGGLIVTQMPGRIAYVDIQTGEVENITNEEDSFVYLRLSADSKTLVATRKIGHYNIWTAPADNNFSADGKNIAFSLGTETSEVVSIENFLSGKTK